MISANARVRLLGPSLLTLLTLLTAAGGTPAGAVERVEVGWLGDYVRIDSSTPAGEARAAEFLARLIQQAGVATERLVGPNGHTSLYARIRGSAPSRGSLLLLHHLDVVGGGAGWSSDPFAGELRDGRLWGRGTLDCKGLGIAQLAAFLELARQPVPPRQDVVFLAVGDEEQGGLRGTRFVLERYPDRLGDVTAVLNEGGTARRINGRLLFWEVEVVQKRPLWLAVEASGRGGHAAGLNPASATHRLIAALARVTALPPRFRITEPARRYFAALAPLHNAHWQRIFTNLELAIGPDGIRDSVLPGMPNLFLDTVQVTVLEASQQINVVAPVARARIDVRLLPDTDADAFLATLREALGPDIAVEVLLSAPVSAPSPTSAAAYQALAEVLGREAPVVPALKPGFTDSRWFRERGVAAYGITPFSLEPQDLFGIHGADERIPIDELGRGIDRLRAIVSRIVSPSG